MKITFHNLPDIIWGTMYGEHRTDKDALILPIKKSELHKTVSDNSIIYIWGWPGPDGNIYNYSDYGETWAFTPEELSPARKYEDVYGKD